MITTIEAMTARINQIDCEICDFLDAEPGTNWLALVREAEEIQRDLCDEIEWEKKEIARWDWLDALEAAAIAA